MRNKSTIRIFTYPSPSFWLMSTQVSGKQAIFPRIPMQISCNTQCEFLTNAGGNELNSTCQVTLTGLSQVKKYKEAKQKGQLVPGATSCSICLTKHKHLIRLSPWPFKEQTLQISHISHDILQKTCLEWIFLSLLVCWHEHDITIHEHDYETFCIIKNGFVCPTHIIISLSMCTHRHGQLTVRRGLRDLPITPSRMSGVLNSCRKPATSWRQHRKHTLLTLTRTQRKPEARFISAENWPGSSRGPEKSSRV